MEMWKDLEAELMHVVPDAKHLQKKDKRNETDLSDSQRKYRYISNGSRQRNKSKFDVRDHIKLRYTELENLRKVFVSLMTKPHTKSIDTEIKKLWNQVRSDTFLKENLRQTAMNNVHFGKQIQRLQNEEYKQSNACLTDTRHFQMFEKIKSDITQRLGKKHSLKRKQSMFSCNNKLLQILIQRMLYQRRIFKLEWHKLLKHISFNKRFLIDLLDRLLLSTTQARKFLKTVKTFKTKNLRSLGYQVAEILNMTCTNAAITKNRVFLETAGYKRKPAEIDKREIIRRSLIRDHMLFLLKMYNEVAEYTIGKFTPEKLSNQQVTDVNELYSKQVDRRTIKVSVNHATKLYLNTEHNSMIDNK